jgi:hypothetical protein
MARELNELRLQLYMPQSMFDGLQRLAVANSVSVSSIMRMIVSGYFAQIGFAPPQPNGHQHQHAAE